jgi:tRNA(fMet)-specific endonuclease VapC
VALILDTNALSALSEGDEKLLRVLRGHAAIMVPVVVLGEFEFGIQRSRRRVHYQEWLDKNLGVIEVLGLGRETARCYANIRRELKVAGKPIPSNDLWIAALCRESGHTLVTRDVHFRFVKGIQTVNW